MIHESVCLQNQHENDFSSGGLGKIISHGNIRWHHRAYNSPFRFATQRLVLVSSNGNRHAFARAAKFCQKTRCATHANLRNDIREMKHRFPTISKLNVQLRFKLALFAICCNRRASVINTDFMMQAISLSINQHFVLYYIPRKNSALVFKYELFSLVWGIDTISFVK